jgi:hypothetical protein
LSLEFVDKDGHVVAKKVQLVDKEGSVCGIQQEWTGSLQLTAPAGTLITGIQSATWGRLLAGSGSNCSSVVFDASCSGDVTAQIQALFTGPASQLTIATQGLRETCSGATKTLKVVANCTPTGLNDYATTYYGYNDFGQLGLVIQPEGTKILNDQGSSSSPLSLAFIRNHCYTYRYDARQRVYEKHIPGDGWTSLVYNRRDQLVATQDQRQATTSGLPWWITKYDALGRPILRAPNKTSFRMLCAWQSS